jgi:hypothetical protein
VCLLLFFLGGAVAANAQDLIILRDGSTIEARVVEISPSEIRYKRFEHLDGPTIVLPAASVLSIRYENGTTELINAVTIAGEKPDKDRPPAMDPDRLYFSVSIDPSGFLLYGPFVLTEFSKNHFNSQIYVSFPSIGLLVYADGFGIGAGATFNYLWPNWLGAFYLGGLFEYSGYEVSVPGLIQMPNGKYTDGKYDYSGEYGWQSSYTFGLNLGYKFILASGIYFTTGGSVGVKLCDDLRTSELAVDFFARPNISMGYNF